MMGVGPEITDADDTFLDIVGYSRADFVSGGMNWAAMTPPEFLHLDEAGIQQALASESGFTAPYAKEFIRKDGTRVPVLLVCAFIPGTEGKWLGYVVNLAPAAPEHAATEDAAVDLGAPLAEDFYGRLVSELARERSRMLAMLDNTDAVVWAVDSEGRLLAANAAFQEVQRQVSGRQMEVGARLLGPPYPPEMVELWRGWYARALAGERFMQCTSVLEPRHMVHEHVLSPILDQRARVVGVAVISQDVSARVATEQALRESEGRFRSLAASAPFGIYLTDASATPLYVNPRLAALWGGDAFANGEWLRHVHQGDLDRVASESQRGRETGAEFEMEFRAVLPALGERHLRVRVAPVQDGARITGWVGIVEDDTERRAIAAHAGQREKMESLGTLAGGIAHDFNNMLGVILGYVEVALDDPTAPDLEVSLREIQTAGGRARDLVRQILTFSRQAQRIDDVVDLGALAAEGVRLLRATLHVPIEATFPTEPVLVRGEASALQQIIINLCTNAAYAMRDRAGTIGVRLDVVVGEAGSDARLCVSDSGCGISPEVLPRLFEPFFTTKPPGAGTGMGLAVVHGVVTSHGGTITVDSAPGGGATFRVALPVISGVPASASAVAPEMSGVTHSGRVLIVEDEPVLARLTGRSLARAGFAVTIAMNGIEGLQVFCADPDRFDLVLTDLTMPGLSGDKLARAIRIVRPELPIILISGFAGGLDDDPAASHVTAILTKPVRPQELLSAIRGALTATR